MPCRLLVDKLLTNNYCLVMTLSTPCRAPALTVRVPTFTHDELRALWEAITQFAENHDEREDVPPGAERALEKLDAYFAGEVLP